MISIISFTEDGKNLGEKIKNQLGQEARVYYNRELDGGVKAYMGKIWQESWALIFISATGIAIRYIKDYIRDKRLDPAVLVLDDTGKYTIPILSGHIGGANELAIKISKILDSQPIITTATDNREIEAIDLFAMKNSYFIENFEKLARITGLMVEGKKLGFYSEQGPIIGYENLIIVEDLNRIDKGIEALIIVSNRLDIKVEGLDYIILRPKNLNLGIGCRRGKSKEDILKAIEGELESLNRSIRSVKAIASVEIKKDEEGLLKAAKELGLEPIFFSVEELGQHEDKFYQSDFVKKTIGVGSVSEPAAYLLGGKELVERKVYDGITLSIREE